MFNDLLIRRVCIDLLPRSLLIARLTLIIFQITRVPLERLLRSAAGSGLLKLYSFLWHVFGPVFIFTFGFFECNYLQKLHHYFIYLHFVLAIVDLVSDLENIFGAFILIDAIIDSIHFLDRPASLWLCEVKLSRILSQLILVHTERIPHIFSFHIR